MGASGMKNHWVNSCIAMHRERATVAELLDVPVAENPDKAAIIFEGSTTTYRQLDGAANRVANALIGMGLEPGDRVAVQLENRPEFVEIFFGIMRAGGVMVPTSVMYKAEEMRHILTDSGSRFLFVSNAVAAIAPQLDSVDQVVELGGTNLPDSVEYMDLVLESSPIRPQVSVQPEAKAVIQYTSGTTGKPKGAVVSHANTVTAINTIAGLPNYPIHKTSVTLLCLPLFHTFGLNFGAGLTFAFGLTMVLVDRFDPTGTRHDRCRDSPCGDRRAIQGAHRHRALRWLWNERKHRNIDVQHRRAGNQARFGRTALSRRGDHNPG